MGPGSPGALHRAAPLSLSRLPVPPTAVAPACSAEGVPTNPWEIQGKSLGNPCSLQVDYLILVIVKCIYAGKYMVECNDPI